MSLVRDRAGLASALAAAALLLPLPVVAQDDASTNLSESIQVTATRLAEDVEPQPSSMTVISGEELAARGVHDLTGALSLVAGVSALPGGDGGPAGSVPEFWGLKEFDAFLLVVDGVPWGGAFNPALTTLDLTGVERIEILRGSAPVMYGATSFVGVIHVIHYQAGKGARAYSLGGGSHSSGGGSLSFPLSASGGYQQSINVGYDKEGFKDDRTDFDRSQLLYRGQLAAGGGQLHFDAAATVVNQSPASPHLRMGRMLSSLTPLDANYNPSDAKLDEKRYHLAAGFNRPVGSGSIGTTLAYTRTERDTIRGFLLDATNTAPNASGFEQDLTVDDLYFEAHWAQKLSEQIQLVLGVDYLYGKAKAESELFDYFVPLSGKGAQSSSSVVHDEETATEDERNFSGLFAQLEWRPTERFLLEVGVRENHTQEKRDAEAHPLGEPEDGEEEGGEASRTTTRASGYIGASYQLWSNDHDGLWVFGDYRDTYKPPAIDFGPEAEGDLLKPETATSYELGLKGRNLGGRLSWQISGFQMDFENLVVSQIVNGSPGLINAGTERFKGIEAEINVELPYDLRLQLAGAYHDAKFKRFTQLFDGEPTALDGKRLELSANDLAALGLTYAPSSGFRGSVEVSYVGDRYLNKRNTALSPSFTTYGASVGYDFGIGELRLEGRNLSDERDPVIESELGDAQYYRLPARSFRLVWSGKF